MSRDSKTNIRAPGAVRSILPEEAEAAGINATTAETTSIAEVSRPDLSRTDQYLAAPTARENTGTRRPNATFRQRASITRTGVTRLRDTQSFASVQPALPNEKEAARYLARKLAQAESPASAIAICAAASQKHIALASGISDWIQRQISSSAGSIGEELKSLPQRQILEEPLAAILLNHFSYRMMAIWRLNPEAQRRYKDFVGDRLRSTDTYLDFDHFKAHVLSEETILHHPDTIQNTGQPLSFDESVVPPELSRHLDRLFEDGSLDEQISNLGRVYQYFFPLDQPFPTAAQNSPDEAQAALRDTRQMAYDGYNGLASAIRSNRPRTPQDIRESQKLLDVLPGLPMATVFSDYWIAAGAKHVKQDKSLNRTGRFYLAIKPAQAREILQTLYNLYDTWSLKRLDVQMKMTFHVEDMLRSDAVVIYTDVASQGLVLEALLALQKSKPQFFRKVPGPVTTAHILDERGQETGISFAEAPEQAQASHGGMLADAVCTACRAWRVLKAAGQNPTKEKLYRMIAANLEASRLDLHHPAFHMGSYSENGIAAFLETFVHTNQFSFQQLPLALEIIRQHSDKYLAGNKSGRTPIHEMMTALVKRAEDGQWKEVLELTEGLIDWKECPTILLGDIRTLNFMAKRRMGPRRTGSGIVPPRRTSTPAMAVTQRSESLTGIKAWIPEALQFHFDDFFIEDSAAPNRVVQLQESTVAHHFTRFLSNEKIMQPETLATHAQLLGSLLEIVNILSAANIKVLTPSESLEKTVKDAISKMLHIEKLQALLGVIPENTVKQLSGAYRQFFRFLFAQKTPIDPKELIAIGWMAERRLANSDLFESDLALARQIGEVKAEDPELAGLNSLASLTARLVFDYDEMVGLFLASGKDANLIEAYGMLANKVGDLLDQGNLLAAALLADVLYERFSSTLTSQANSHQIVSQEIKEAGASTGLIRPGEIEEATRLFKQLQQQASSSAIKASSHTRGDQWSATPRMAVDEPAREHPFILPGIKKGELVNSARPFSSPAHGLALAGNPEVRLTPHSLVLHSAQLLQSRRTSNLLWKQASLFGSPALHNSLMGKMPARLFR